MDPQDLFPEVPEDITGLTDEQIEELVAGFNDAFGRVATGEAFADMEDPPDRNARREMLATARDQLKTLKAALEERHEEDEEWNREVAELASEAGVELSAEGEVPEGETQPEGETPEGETAPEGETPEAVETPEGETSPEGEVPEEEIAPEGELQAAGQRQYRHRPPATPRRHQPLTTGHGVALTAAAGHAEFKPGQELDREALAILTREVIRQGVSAPPGLPFKMRIAQADWSSQYPEDRRVHGDDPHADMRKLDDVRSRRALAAAGGWCAPSTIRYDVGTLGVTERPVRDNLVAFNATRGGLRYFVDLSIAATDTTDGITRLTEAQDEGGTTTKDCVVIECPTDTDVRADIIASCLQAGNLASIAFPELIAAWQDLLAIATARNADSGLLDAIAADPQTKRVTASAWYGGLPSVVNAFATLAAGYRSRHRLGAGDPLIALAPAHLADRIVIDVASTATPNLELARAQVAARIEALTGVRVEWYLDSETGENQIFGEQGDAAAVLGFPNPSVIYMYPPGGIGYLDQGQLNIGLIRDSALTETNDVRFFSEFFENAFVIAAEVFKLELTFCHDGLRAPAGSAETCGATI